MDPEVNNSYHYKPVLTGGWMVLNLVDGKCATFPERGDQRVIPCTTEHEAQSCAQYHAMTFGGNVTRGGRS